MTAFPDQSTRSCASIPGPGSDSAIVIVGGHNSVWTSYLKMARYLEDLTGMRTVAVPLLPWDWWLVDRARDASRLLGKLSNTMAWARRRHAIRRFVLVGHSAGGLLCRLYLCDAPLWGRVYAGFDHVQAVVTLGSPHCSERCSGCNSIGWFLIDSTNQMTGAIQGKGPVSFFAIAGRYVQGAQGGSPKESRAFRYYQSLGGDGSAWGDGIVPLSCAHLPDAENLILDGVAHSARIGHQWYGGSKAAIRDWWPRGERCGG